MATEVAARERTGWQGRYFEDFEVGDVYRHPLGRTLTAADNSWLTLLTQNTAPLHFDAHYAAQTSWRRPLVNSTITLALVTGQSVTDVSQHVFANLGWDAVRLPAPVFEGDTIYSRSTVLEKRESGSRPDVGIVGIETEGLNQDGVVVISFRRTMMVFRRGHGPDAAAPVAPPGAAGPSARSWLFVPGDRPERFDKAVASAADAVILDLEDGVAPEAKAAARREIVAWLGAGGQAWVRIAAASAPEWDADLRALAPAAAGLLGVVLAKAEHPGEIAATLARLPVPLVALVETAAGIENAGEVARAPGVAALALGVADLGAELGLGADPLAWAYPRGRLVVASRAAGLPAPIDGPTLDLDDPTAVAADAERARELGFGGKLCVHPRQAPAVNRALAPTAEELAWARRVLAAGTEAGGGAVRVDGEMVDRPRLERARALLAAAADAGTGPEARGVESSGRAAAEIEAFHRSLPGFQPTPLIEAPALAAALGVERAFVKHERERLGLPSFKVLGASWAINGEIARRAAVAPPSAFEETRRLAAALPAGTTLSTATEGNHGHGVARVARLLGLAARIYVPAGIAPARVAAIEAEGATVVPVDGSYDDAVRFAAEEAARDAALVLVSDTSWPGYEEIPRAISAGYATIFEEAYAQLEGLGGTAFDLAFVPAGVGALAAAAVAAVGARGGAVVTVEPTVADCVRRSLAAGEPVAVPGPHDSVMAGLNCGEVSRVAWPILRDGVHAALAVDDAAAVEAMRLLATLDVRSGAAGAAPLAGALALARGGWEGAPEGARPGAVLLVASEAVTDPAGYAALVNGPR